MGKDVGLRLIAVAAERPERPRNDVWKRTGEYQRRGQRGGESDLRRATMSEGSRSGMR
jgi:hypothetical protein